MKTEDAEVWYSRV